jgi:hypothetical protein
VKRKVSAAVRADQLGMGAATSCFVRLRGKASNNVSKKFSSRNGRCDGVARLDVGSLIDAAGRHVYVPACPIHQPAPTSSARSEQWRNAKV